MDRGHAIGEIKQSANEAFLDDHPSGFNRKGSMIDHYHFANRSSMIGSNGLSQCRSPSLQQLSDQKLNRNVSKNTSPLKNKTELLTGREPDDFTHDFMRDSINYATGDATIKGSSKTIEALLIDDSEEDEMMKFGQTEAAKSGEKRLNT